MPTPNLSELVSTTLRFRRKELRDNVTKNNALLNRLMKRGKIEKIDGGRTIVEPIMHSEVGTAQWYSGYETLNVSPSETISAAEYDWKQLAASVTISGLEQLQNAGKSQLISLLKSRIEAAEATLENNVEAALFGDGTASGGKVFGGLQQLIADSPSTGTIGGINRATYTFWQNQVTDVTSFTGGASSSSNLISAMNNLWVKTTRAADHPDLVLADNEYYVEYLGGLQAIQRITGDDMAQAGFTSLKFMNADVVLCGGYQGSIPSQHMYFLNTKYLKFVAHEKRFMDEIGGDRQPVNQDAIVKILALAGNLTMSCAFVQGVLKE